MTYLFRSQGQLSYSKDIEAIMQARMWLLLASKDTINQIRRMLGEKVGHKLKRLKQFAISPKESLQISASVHEINQSQDRRFLTQFYHDIQKSRVRWQFFPLNFQILS